LSNSLVDDDERVFRQDSLLCWIKAVLLLHDLFELFKLVPDDLGSHGVANSISVDEDVIRKQAIVVVSKCLEGALEILLEYA